eukprot:190222-Hanusia_phi.AAC.1
MPAAAVPRSPPAGMRKFCASPHNRGRWIPAVDRGRAKGATRKKRREEEKRCTSFLLGSSQSPPAMILVRCCSDLT